MTGKTEIPKEQQYQDIINEIKKLQQILKVNNTKDIWFEDKHDYRNLLLKLNSLKNKAVRFPKSIKERYK